MAAITSAILGTMAAVGTAVGASAATAVGVGTAVTLGTIGGAVGLGGIIGGQMANKAEQASRGGGGTSQASSVAKAMTLTELQAGNQNATNQNVLGNYTTDTSGSGSRSRLLNL